LFFKIFLEKNKIFYEQTASLRVGDKKYKMWNVKCRISTNVMLILKSPFFTSLRGTKQFFCA
jgi:hypothetical protein